MPYLTPNFEAVRDAILRDIANQLPEAATGPDSDYFVRASAVGGAVEGLYQHQQWLTRQIFPDTADTDYLVHHAEQRGLSRRSAVAAEGSTTFTGTPGAALPAGLVLTRADGAVFTTMAAAVLDAGGLATIAVRAQVPGVAGNSAAGSTLTLSSAPSGVSGTAVVVTLLGGTDAETDAELLARLLDVLRHPPAGGNVFDFRRWALEVAGISQAYVYPLRRGPGTVDVLVTAAAGLPSASTLTAVFAHIDALRPVGMKDIQVLAPTLLPVDFTVAVSVASGTLLDMTPAIEAALAGLMDTLAPADVMVKSQAEALISNLSGIVDRAITLPAGNVTPINNGNTVEWCRLGTVTVIAL